LSFFEFINLANLKLQDLINALSSSLTVCNTRVADINIARKRLLFYSDEKYFPLIFKAYKNGKEKNKKKAKENNISENIAV
jgi:hypothetical protein